MTPKAKLTLLHFIRFNLILLRWILTLVIVEVMAIFISSPVVLIILCIFNALHKALTLFNENYMLAWLTASILAFIPMFIYVITGTIKKNKVAKKEAEEQQKQAK